MMTLGRLKEDFRKTYGRLQEEMKIFICQMKRVLELHLFWLRISTQVSLRSLSSLNILRRTVGA